MSTIKLIHNAIFGGRFYTAGEPIEKSIIPASMRKYEAKENKPPAKNDINLRRQYGRQYHVDPETGQTTTPVHIRREIAEMQAANEFQEYTEDVASEEVDEVTAAAIAQEREKLATEIERQKRDAKIIAERADALEESVIQEHNEAFESGEFDEMDSDPRKPKRPARVIGQKLFVKRDGKFIRAHDVEVIPGEALFRHRPRALGQTAMFIKHKTAS